MSKWTAGVTEQERGKDIWGQTCQGKGILNNEGIGLRFEEEFEKEPWVKLNEAWESISGD